MTVWCMFSGKRKVQVYSSVKCRFTWVRDQKSKRLDWLFFFFFNAIESPYQLSEKQWSQCHQNGLGETLQAKTGPFRPRQVALNMWANQCAVNQWPPPWLAQSCKDPSSQRLEHGLMLWGHHVDILNFILELMFCKWSPKARQDN